MLSLSSNRAFKNVIMCCEILYFWFSPHIRRQATQHDCLPSLSGDEDKLSEKLYVDEKSVLYWALGRQDENLDESNEPTKERFLSFVLLESPFVSIS
jgi:hypothetical protein